MLFEPFTAEELGPNGLLRRIGKNGDTALEGTSDKMIQYWDSLSNLGFWPRHISPVHVMRLQREHTGSEHPVHARFEFGDSVHPYSGGSRSAGTGPQGEDVLRKRLSLLELEQLKDVVAEYGMDAGKLVMKWKDTMRIIDRIVELSLARSTKGDAFRADKPPATEKAGE
jgi:hypothetical protein